MVVYTLEQRWEVVLRSAYRRCRQKNHIFRWSSFRSWRVCKQAKLLHLGHRKPACIHWKADAPKWVTVCGFFFENEQGESITVNGDHYRAMLNEFFFTKIEEEATFGFNSVALRATQPQLHSMFCALFLKIALSAAARRPVATKCC